MNINGARKGLTLASDLSSLEAGGADILALGVPVDQSAHTLDIWIPATTGTSIRVRDVISEAWTLATDIAYRCHGRSPCYPSW